MKMRDDDDFLEETKSRVEKIVSDVTEKGRTLFNEGLKSARGILDERSEAIKEKATEMSDKTLNELANDLKAYIRRHPFKSMGIAAGAGVLLGFLLKSNSRD